MIKASGSAPGWRLRPQFLHCLKLGRGARSLGWVREQFPQGPHARTGNAQTRDVLLGAIGRARIWIRDLTDGRVSSFEEIACREGKGDRHVRLLASLAFVSPRIVAAIVDGNAPAGLTVTGLARALPAGWAEQERQIGIV